MILISLVIVTLMPFKSLTKTLVMLHKIIRLKISTKIVSPHQNTKEVLIDLNAIFSEILKLKCKKLLAMDTKNYL